MNLNADDMQFFTDATPKGFGGYFQRKWFFGHFDKNLVPDNTKAPMALFELYPVAMTNVLSGPLWCK